MSVNLLYSLTFTGDERQHLHTEVLKYAPLLIPRTELTAGDWINKSFVS